MMRNKDLHRVVEKFAVTFGIAAVLSPLVIFQGPYTVPAVANKQWVERQTGANITLNQKGVQEVYRVDYVDAQGKKTGFSVSCIDPKQRNRKVFVDVFRRISSGDKGVYGYVYVQQKDAQKIVEAHEFCTDAFNAVGRQ